MRSEIEELVAFGAFPSEGMATAEQLSEIESLLARISKPISNEEAVALVRLFGPDDFYGIAWTLVHLIESAPGWPITSCLNGPHGTWLALLSDRAGLAP